MQPSAITAHQKDKLSNRSQLALTRFSVLAALVFALADADAAEPLSAIDWSKIDEAIEVVPLEEASARILPDVMNGLNPDAAGVLSHRISGFPADLWSSSESRTIQDLIGQLNSNMVSAAIDLAVQLLIAESNPPADSTGGTELFLSRIDRLIALGALEPAQAMLDILPHDDPELFARRFDIALLMGRERNLCREMRDRPAYAPSIEALIFCLARIGEWRQAAVIFAAQNAIEGDDWPIANLVAGFLDPSSDRISTGLADLTDPLLVRMSMRVGNDLSHLSLTPTLAWIAYTQSSQHLLAAEFLARIRAISSSHLMVAYENAVAAEDEAIGKRASAVIALRDAVESGRPGPAPGQVARLFADVADPALMVAVSEFFAPKMHGLSLAPEDMQALRRMRLLAQPDDNLEYWLFSNELVDRQEPAAMAHLQTAIVNGFEPASKSVAVGQAGEIVLRALTSLASGTPGTSGQSVENLRNAGFGQQARHIAVQIYLSAGV